MDDKVFDAVEKHAPKMRAAGFGMTASEYSRKKGCSIQYARKILEELVDNGILEKDSMLSGKSVSIVYFIPKK